MKFIDRAEIFIKAGDGGHGCLSFRREKFVPKGGPDGGDGARGGNVVVEAAENLWTLMDLRYKRTYKAKTGGHGRGSNKHGKNGADVVIKVPCGTIIYEKETNELLCDLTENGQKFVCAYGGKGGKGNARFKSSTNQAPYEYEKGEPGEEKKLLIELKLIADVGLVGLPNAGKSTFLNQVSSAKSKVASYPFTTLSPVLGVVEKDYEHRFVIADIPGLIKGAHEGTGLGDKFLCHIERTGVLLFLIDVSKFSQNDPVNDFKVLYNELSSYNKKLVEKRMVIALNKIDDVDEDKVEGFRAGFCRVTGTRFLKNKKPGTSHCSASSGTSHCSASSGTSHCSGDSDFKVYEVSGLTGDGCDELVEVISELVTAKES